MLNRKRKLSLTMSKRLHDGLRIPYEILLAGAWQLYRGEPDWTRSLTLHRPLNIDLLQGC